MLRYWTRSARLLTSVPIAIALASCASHDSAGERDETTAAALSTPAPAAITTSRFVAYAARSLTLGANDVVLGGDLGVQRAAPSAFGSQLSVGAGAFVAPAQTLFAPSVSLAASAKVGSVAASAVQNDGGTYSSLATFPSSMPAPPLARAATPGAANVSVPALTTQTLSPGSYGALSVSGILTLAPGTYSFASITVADHGVLFGGLGDVDVRVAGAFSAGKWATVAPSFLQTADKLAITVGAADAPNGPVAAAIGASSVVTALFAAPRGTLAIGDGAVVTGALSGFDVSLGSGALLTYQAGFSPTATGQAGSQALSGYLAPAVAAAPVVGPVPPSTLLHMSLTLPIRNAAGLTAFLQAVNDPTSATYRHYQTQAQIEAAYGASAADYATLAAWAQSWSLTLSPPSADRLLLAFTGTAANLEQALHVGLQVALRPDGTQFFAPDREPSVDLALAVRHVGGLDNYAQPKVLGGSVPSGGYGTHDLRAAYVPCTSMTGAGQSVGVFSWLGIDPVDVADFQSQMMSPPSSVAVTSIQYGTAVAGLPTTGDDSEPASDIAAAITMAPGLSSVVLFQGQQDGTDGDEVVKGMQTYTPIIRQFTASMWPYISPSVEDSLSLMEAAGQAFFMASGDSGAEPAQGGFPAAGANLTIVGGTDLVMNGAGVSYASETVWTDPGWNPAASTGGGVAAITQPSWQSGINWALNGGSTTQRNFPDVSMVAAGVATVFTSGSLVHAHGTFEGTSVASPLWAGLMALVNQQNTQQGNSPIGDLNAALYQIAKTPAYATTFHDVLTGAQLPGYYAGAPYNMPPYDAVPGFDLVTGWGTPQCGVIDELACVKCGGSSCVDRTTDANNCGACGNVCPGGAACVAGACTTCTTPGRWTEDAYVATDHDNAKQLWQRSYAGPMTWAAANTYCGALNLDGLTGWSVPLIAELRTLVLNPSGLQSCGPSHPNYCCPSDDHVAFPSDPGTTVSGLDNYWAGDPINTGCLGCVDTVGFQDGRTFVADPTDGTDVFVRCTHAPVP